MNKLSRSQCPYHPFGEQTVLQSSLRHSQTPIVAGYTLCWNWPSSCCLDGSIPTNRQHSLAICANNVVMHSPLRHQASKQSATATTTEPIHDTFSKTPPPRWTCFSPQQCASPQSTLRLELAHGKTMSSIAYLASGWHLPEHVMSVPRVTNRFHEQRRRQQCVFIHNQITCERSGSSTSCNTQITRDLKQKKMICTTDTLRGPCFPRNPCLFLSPPPTPCALI